MKPYLPVLLSLLIWCHFWETVANPWSFYLNLVHPELTLACGVNLNQASSLMCKYLAGSTESVGKFAFPLNYFSSLRYPLLFVWSWLCCCTLQLLDGIFIHAVFFYMFSGTRKHFVCWDSWRVLQCTVVLVEAFCSVLPFGSVWYYLSPSLSGVLMKLILFNLYILKICSVFLVLNGLS